MVVPSFVLFYFPFCLIIWIKVICDACASDISTSFDSILSLCIHSLSFPPCCAVQLVLPDWLSVFPLCILSKLQCFQFSLCLVYQFIYQSHLWTFDFSKCITLNKCVFWFCLLNSALGFSHSTHCDMLTGEVILCIPFLLFVFYVQSKISNIYLLSSSVVSGCSRG